MYSCASTLALNLHSMSSSADTISLSASDPASFSVSTCCSDASTRPEPALVSSPGLAQTPSAQSWLPTDAALGVDPLDEPVREA